MRQIAQKKIYNRKKTTTKQRSNNSNDGIYSRCNGVNSMRNSFAHTNCSKQIEHAKQSAPSYTKQHRTHKIKTKTKIQSNRTKQKAAAAAATAVAAKYLYGQRVLIESPINTNHI